jgi:hypothetical protein
VEIVSDPELGRRRICKASRARLTANGVVLDPAQWVRDEDAKKMLAQSAYDKANCALIE